MLHGRERFCEDILRFDRTLLAGVQVGPVLVPLLPPFDVVRSPPQPVTRWASVFILRRDIGEILFVETPR
jgi:hypothetical protein